MKASIDDVITKFDVVGMVKKATKLSERHIAERIIKRDDFPSPLKKLGRTELYLRPDIMKWLGLRA